MSETPKPYDPTCGGAIPKEIPHVVYGDNSWLPTWLYIPVHAETGKVLVECDIWAASATEGMYLYIADEAAWNQRIAELTRLLGFPAMDKFDMRFACDIGRAPLKIVLRAYVHDGVYRPDLPPLDEHEQWRAARQAAQTETWRDRPPLL